MKTMGEHNGGSRSFSGKAAQVYCVAVKPELS